MSELSDLNPEIESEESESALTPEETVNYPVRLLALAWHLEIDPDDLTRETYPHNAFSTGRYHTYLVLTDDEANEAAADSARSYLEEFVLEQIPTNLHVYFDDDRFVEDAVQQDGRGHLISSYDGSEDEIDLRSESFREWLYQTFGIDQTTDPESIEFEDEFYGDSNKFYIFHQ
jgi:hypothetical protein